MKLGNIATVRSGLVLSRKRGKQSSGIGYPLLTLRALQPSGFIDVTELDNFWASEVLAPEYVSQIGDIVVRLTAPYTAVLIDNKTQGIVISSNFVIIKADKTKILPEYLYWLLNTQKVKLSIYERATSNMLGAVKTRYFSEFKIYPIDLDAQKKVAEVNRLAKREAFLLRRLAEEKEKYYTAVIDKMQKEVRNHD